MSRVSRPLEELDKELFKDPETAALYLAEILQDNDVELFKLALKDVAAARLGSVKALAEKAEVGRESLYKSLSETGNPKLETLTKVLGAAGLQLSVTAATP